VALGKRKRQAKASVDVGRHRRSAAQRRTSLLRVPESDSRRVRLRRVRRRALRAFLRAEGRPGLPPGRYFRLLL